MILPNLLVFGCPTSALKAASSLGIRVVNFEKRERVTDEKIAAVAELHEIDWENPSSYLSLAQDLHAKQPFDGVVAFGEWNVFAASLIGETLGIKSNRLKSVVIAKDKALMRGLLQEKGLSAVKFESIRRRPDSIACKANELEKRIGLPLVLKPQDGSGSSKVQRCESVSEIEVYLADFFENDKSTSVCIAEEFLDGPEISVETISFDGVHHLLALTEKKTSGAPNYIETGHYIPANLNGILSEDLKTEIEKLVFATLNLIGHELGPSHTELKLTSSGPRIIETHTRPGGDCITSLVELATGINVFVETFRFLAFGSCDIPKNKLSRVASSQFFLTNGGLCAEHDGVELLAQSDFVTEFELKFKVDDELPVSVDSHSRAGHFVAVAPTRSVLDDLVSSIREGINLSAN